MRVEFKDVVRQRLVTTAQDGLDLAQQTAGRVFGTVFSSVSRSRRGRGGVAVHVGNAGRSVLPSSQSSSSIIIDVRTALGRRRRVGKVARNTVSRDPGILSMRSGPDAGARDARRGAVDVESVGTRCAAEVGTLHTLVAGAAGGSVVACGSVLTDVGARVAEAVRVLGGGGVVGSGSVGSVFGGGAGPDARARTEARVLLASDRVRGKVVAGSVRGSTGLLTTKGKHK